MNAYQSELVGPASVGTALNEGSVRPFAVPHTAEVRQTRSALLGVAAIQSVSVTHYAMH